MKVILLILRPFLSRMLATAVLGSVSMGVNAADTEQRTVRHGTLVVGMSSVAPTYAAGTRFRTPENIDSTLAESIAGYLNISAVSVPVPSIDPASPLMSRKADIVMAAVSESASLHKSVVVVPTGYSTAPMAIMRTDTDIKTWEQLKGRKICVSGDGRYVGTLARKYGAIEKVFRAPADSLLALRIGDCDAAVHDSVMLEQLLKLPEWKKFSARLPAGQSAPLVFVVPVADTRTVKLLSKAVKEWSSTGHLQQVTGKMVRNIAFEVYLDQNVPDCH